MRFGVVGCGRWGSFLAWYCDRAGHDVTLYGREGSERMRAFMQTRTNGLVTLPAGISMTTDLTALKGSDVIIVSVNSQAFRTVCRELAQAGLGSIPLVLCMKGLELNTGKRLSVIAKEELGTNAAVWLGPGHVQEFVRGVPNCMVIDSLDADYQQMLIGALSSPLIRFYYGNDIIGSEIGAASKNVIGIAAGMLDGLEHAALKGALMSRGTREISRLIEAMGGNPLSAYGLCHLGDYEATVFSPHSHNRAFGEAFVRGQYFGSLAEGTYTARALMSLSAQLNVDLPIANAVCSVIYDGRKPADALGELFMRSLKREF